MIQPAQKVSDDELIAALREHGSNRKAARALGINPRTIERRRNNLARKGYSPQHDMTHAVPDGFKVKGVSTLYGEDGSIRGQWVKSSEDRERQAELLRASLEAMAQELPKLPPRKAFRTWRSDLLTVYPIGDPHLGQLSWQAETGDSWDLAIAERVHCGAMNALVEAAPATDEALIVNLGDALHYDSLAPVTPRSGHPLDADGRYAKMVGVAVKVIRQCIESALEKHRKVRIINAPGNHDETGALWLSIALSHIYEREPRVEVDTSPSVFAYHRFGKCLVGVHHGHTCKAEALPGVMAHDRASDWGETRHRYWLTGHVHHVSRKEFPGVIVETFGSLASRDAYATNGGWRSRESMTALVLHREHGEVARHVVTPAMLRDAA